MRDNQVDIHKVLARARNSSSTLVYSVRIDICVVIREIDSNRPHSGVQTLDNETELFELSILMT